MNQVFLQRMKEYLTDEEYTNLLKEYELDPQRSIRLNKIDKDIFFKNFNYDVDKIEYDPNGYYLNTQEKLGNHPYHHLGAFYIQEPSAMAPVNMYNFKGDEIVLDLCAAPGGKSTQILSRIPNGILFTNDPSKSRSKVLFSNIERLGFKNAVVLNETPDRLSKYLGGLFDVILVDSPCSGEGMMRKEPDASAMWSLDNILNCAKRDIEILTHADKMLKENGILIYSTCTFAKEEDEDIINCLINNLGYEVLPANPILKKYTKESDVLETLKFYPFTGRGEGQYMALLRKKTPSIETYKIEKPIRKNDEFKIVEKFISENLNTSVDITKIGNRYYAKATNIDISPLHVISNGVELGEVLNKRFIPYHHLFKALGDRFKRRVKLDVSNPLVLHYIRGEEIGFEAENGYGVIEIDGLYLGGYKCSSNRLKNHYPKGLRNMNLIED